MVCRLLKLAYERNAGEFEATDVTSPCMLFSEITDHPRGILGDQNGNSYADSKAAREGSWEEGFTRNGSGASHATV